MNTRHMELSAGLTPTFQSSGDHFRISERSSNAGRPAASQSLWKMLTGLAQRLVRTSPAPALFTTLGSDRMRKQCIVVVSANPYERRRIINSIDANRFDVVAVATFTEAIAAAKAVDVQLMIVDVFRPGLVGTQILRLLGLPQSIKVLLVADHPESWPFEQGEYGTQIMSKDLGTEARRAHIESLFPGSQETVPVAAPHFAALPAAC